MKYSEALKEVQKQKAQERYMRLELTYGTYMILPYEAGMQVLKALKEAEYCKTPYSDPPTIKPLGPEDLKFEFYTAEERQQCHMAQLLQVSLRDLEGLKRQETEPPF